MIRWVFGVSNHDVRNVLSHMRLSYAQKLSLVAAVPLILAVAAIAVLVAVQSRALAEREIQTLETQLIEAKKRELRNYVTQARNGFYFIYGVRRAGRSKSQRPGCTDLVRHDLWR